MLEGLKVGRLAGEEVNALGIGKLGPSMKFIPSSSISISAEFMQSPSTSSSVTLGVRLRQDERSA